MRLSDPQCFRVLGFVCTQPSCCWDGDVGAGGGQSSRSWSYVLLETFVAQGEHPLHRELGKAPGCHCRQMAAGSLRFLPRQVDANPAGFLTLFLPLYIPRAAVVTGPSMAAQPVHWRGLSAARSPSALPESCSLGEHLAADGISQAIPQAWNQMEPCDCRAHPPAVTSSPPQCWGWPCGGATGLGHTSRALHAAELSGGSCLGLAGSFRVLC